MNAKNSLKKAPEDMTHAERCFHAMLALAKLPTPPDTPMHGEDEGLMMTHPPDEAEENAIFNRYHVTRQDVIAFWYTQEA